MHIFEKEKTKMKLNIYKSKQKLSSNSTIQEKIENDESSHATNLMDNQTKEDSIFRLEHSNKAGRLAHTKNNRDRQIQTHNKFTGYALL